LEARLGALNFEHHKMIVVIEASSPEVAAAINVSAPHLASCSGNKILNALLRFGSFVDVIVTRQGYVYTVTSK
jgi:hypothetical protein